MSIAKQYFEGLKKAYYEIGEEKEWDNFEKKAHGASSQDIEKLKTKYPDIPNSLLDLLNIVDGTYWREYEGEKFNLYFLGSDIEEYPYYLLSAEEMAQSKEEFDWLTDYLDIEFDYIEIDKKITDNIDKMCWLHFSDCMNNGGTSQLFIDFSPSSKGVKGQIVRYLHDPDEFVVIANSFDEYLQMLMDSGYDFIQEDEE